MCHAKAYSAASETSPLARTTIARRDPTEYAASVELTPDDLREIDDAASLIEVQGARYPEELERRPVCESKFQGSNVGFKL